MSVRAEQTGGLTAADVMTAAEVAELLHVPRSTVEDWARRGILPSRKIGRRRLYLRPAVEALLLHDTVIAPDPQQAWRPRLVDPAGRNGV